MNQEEKNKIAQRLSARVETGLSFIEFDYLDRHEKPDAAWIRNIYILLSFYTELLLKAIFVASKEFSDISDLDKKLKGVGHNLSNLGHQMGARDLLKFGIKQIKPVDSGFEVQVNDVNFFTEDFTDIRYDFIECKIRKLNGTEHESFRKQIDILRKINKTLKEIIW